MASEENKISIANSQIDWNKLKAGIKKEQLSTESQSLWAKLNFNANNENEIDQTELDALKNDLAQAIQDKQITNEEAAAYLASKSITDVGHEAMMNFMVELGNISEQMATEEEAAANVPKAEDFGFIDGKIENLKIDARAAGITNREYQGFVKIPDGEQMPSDGSMPKVLMMKLPDAYGENKFTKLTYNEADGTYMSRYKDMAFKFEKDADGNVTLKAVDDDALKAKREKNLKEWKNEQVIRNTPEPEPEPVPEPVPVPEPEPEPEQPTNTGKDLGLDNYYGNSFQEGQGDCYLMATINAIRNLHNGQEILQNLRTEKVVNGKKIYTITLPGAKLAAEGLKEDNLRNGIFITGEYSFTEDELRDILDQAGSRYSNGDPDVIVLEAAFEKYRDEVRQTLEANNISLDKYWLDAGMISGENINNILEGGYSHDATFILCGQKSELYVSLLGENTPSLSVEELHNNKALPYISAGNSGRISLMSVREVEGPVQTTESALDDMLNELQKDYESDQKFDKIATASFMVADEDSKGGHAFTIKQVTADKVILINPWYPDKELTITRQEFKLYAKSVTISTDGNSRPKTIWERIKELIKFW